MLKRVEKLEEIVSMLQRSIEEFRSLRANSGENGSINDDLIREIYARIS